MGGCAVRLGRFGERTWRIDMRRVGTPAACAGSPAVFGLFRPLGYQFFPRIARLAGPAGPDPAALGVSRPGAGRILLLALGGGEVRLWLSRRSCSPACCASCEPRLG